MKRSVQILVVLALVLTIIGVANAGQLAKGNASGDSSLFPKSIVVTGSGFFDHRQDRTTILDGFVLQGGEVHERLGW